MEGVVAVLIPIVALLIPIFALYFNFKKEQLKRQERMKAIEKGVELPPEPEITVFKKNWLESLRNSVIFLSIGISFLLTYLVLDLFFKVMKEKVVIAFLGIGIVHTFLGLGLLIYSLILKKYEKE